MMKYLKTYLKERIKFITFFIAVMAIFSLTLLLMDVPLRALLYPLGLSFFLLAMALCAGYIKAEPRLKELESLDKITLSAIDSMPMAYGEEAKAYRNAIKLLGDEYRKYAGESESRFESMINYYTVWAHQIKTPISSMKLLLQEEDGDVFRRLSADLFRIEQYVDMVLVYLRLDSESTDYVFRECNMNDVIKKSVRNFASEFIGRKLSLEYEPADVTVISDPKWLGFVIGQIISNSLKYTKEGAIRIYYRSPKVLVIEDTGIGIAKEDLPRIFEKGYTGYNGRGCVNSSGIGLYLVSRVCENLHIGLRAESQIGEGTRILLDLNQYELKNE